MDMFILNNPAPYSCVDFRSLSHKFSIQMFVYCVVLQTIPEAQNYFKRRTEYLTKQMEKLQPALQEKFRMKQGA